MTVYPESKIGPDSWDLVRAAQAGDRQAFGRLYEQYRPRVQGLLRGKVRDQALVEDLTSETFLRALRRIDSVSQQREDPGAWLSTIARNLVLDHARSARTRLDRTTDQIPEPRVAEQGTEAQAEARAERAAAAATVARVLERLPADQRRAVRVRDLDEVSLAETAARMGRSETSVKGLRWRAMAAMREQLAAEGLTSTRECAEAVARAQAAVARLRHERTEAQTGSDSVRGRHRPDQREIAEQHGRQDGQVEGRVDGRADGSEDGRESDTEFDVLGGAA